MTIRHGRNKATFQLVQDPQIIEVRRVEAGTSVSINAIKLATFVEKIKGFCVAEDTRYYATGAYLWIDKLCMHAVASDSQRLAKIEIPISVERQADDAVIVPRRALDEVARVCSNLSGDVTISWHKESETFQLQAETYFMTARCISGAYPPWQAACPSNINLSVELAKCELIDSLRLAARCADKTNGIIKLSFKGEELEISSFSAGSKEGTHIIDAYSGSVPFECSYPSALLIDALNSVDSDKVSIEWDNVNRPARIRCEDESFFYLIVPTRY
jgi:DNA polymerase-3 subunit beta